MARKKRKFTAEHIAALKAAKRRKSPIARVRRKAKDFQTGLNAMLNRLENLLNRFESILK